MYQDLHKKAKLSVLDKIQNMSDDEMLSKMKGIKKVTVASDSSKGLEKGLDKAKEIAGGIPAESSEDKELEEASEEMESEGSEMDRSSDESAEPQDEKHQELLSYLDGCSPEQLSEFEAKIQELKNISKE